MVILGIDPGLNATGYGVITADQRGLRVVAAGVITPPARQPLGRRLVQLHDAVERIIVTRRPTLMALEAIFTHHQYLTTATLMAHARGVACLAGAQHRLQLVEYLPTRVKKSVTGYGTASKPQIAKAVGMWLGVDTAGWASDVTDALAVAIAHAHISAHTSVPVRRFAGATVNGHTSARAYRRTGAVT